ncbi:RNA-binding S4 domain-containing protein [Fusibacter tunisiensis]|uniref:RQC P-site tRNA stabilizing factor n=1 Tax=Fusibacter tunisiensis TaxID=1008308 RepID=A0ABS2MR90_9FIRM|nr:RNA-binding S4 domain-containing protein [Fusibacter tunisiensis]MBM7561904.1 ribosomal 50S subunit-recycling heat shock protein [Fusibacter tunisiensis]
MRIDKYLKNARLIKRRTIAKEACEQGKITINDKLAKPGSEVAIGDQITMSLGSKTIAVKVTGLEEHVTKESAKDLYEMISE